MKHVNLLLSLVTLAFSATCGTNCLWGQTQIPIKVDNKTAGPVTIKSIDLDLKNKTFVEKDLHTINAGETRDVNVAADTDLTYVQNGEAIGSQSPKAGDIVYLRKPGLEFNLIQIHCSVADDEGPAAFGDEIEFNGKLQLTLRYGDTEQKRDPQHIYVEGLDDNSSRPLGNYWSFEVPSEFVDAAKMTLSWSETWEEDNASSSQDDTLTVEDNHRTLEQIKSLGPIEGSFRIIGTDASNPDADVSISYKAKAIQTFEVKSR